MSTAFCQYCYDFYVNCDRIIRGDSKGHSRRAEDPVDGRSLVAVHQAHHPLCSKIVELL